VASLLDDEARTIDNAPVLEGSKLIKYARECWGEEAAGAARLRRYYTMDKVGLIKWPSDGASTGKIPEAIEWINNGNYIGLKKENNTNNQPIVNMEVYIRTNCRMEKDKNLRIFAKAKIAQITFHKPDNWSSSLDECECYFLLTDIEQIQGYDFPSGSFTKKSMQPWPKIGYATFMYLDEQQLNEILRVVALVINPERGGGQ
jgi:hypothetical protein